jgi:SAM-dependent methyltransferase
MADVGAAPGARDDRAFLREVQYRTDANLAARQSIYAYQQPRLDLPARVLDLVEPLPPGGVVADIGCGNGAYLAELARRGFRGRLAGGDLSPGMLAAARERAPAAGLMAADASMLPLRDASVDVALCMHMLYHVPDPMAVVRELRRVTRPGGVLVVGLNGGGHLRELREAIAGAGGGYPRERVDLDGGEALARAVFASVARHDFPGELVLDSPQPVAAYVRSTSGAVALADPDALVTGVITRAFPAGPGHVFRVATHAGCLVCR